MSEEGQPGAALVGAVLANSYEIVRLIGRGGMGAVYEGRHLRLGQKLAIKVMAGDLANTREALSRFRREAEVTSGINHPHIVHVFDFGSARSGEPFLVMEFLDGEDLEHRISRLGRLPVAATVHVVKQTAAALAAAHAKDIVHRDLKPANVFLLNLDGEADFVKVVDFGISKVKAAATKLTRSSVVMGTPDYMSPEQARGKIDEIDHRTDQWALAAIAYEMLCGRTPFAGEDVASVLYQVTREDPEPLSLRVPGLSVEIERAIHRGLSKRPGDRFASVTAFARALEDAARGQPALIVAGTARPRPVNTPQKATVAYGKRGGPHQDDASDTPKELGAPSPSAPAARSGREKRTTFSHATGEATLAGSWAHLRQRPRWVVAGAGGLLSALVVWLALGRSGPSENPVSKGRDNPVRSKAASSASVTPLILPLESPPPAFVGPPAPSSEELARARSQYPAAATRSIEAQPGGMPERKEVVPGLAPGDRPLSNPFQEVAPEAPTDLPAVPARPKRQIIKEL